METELNIYGREAMTSYGNSVNWDRALPEAIDGLKPVQRRILWGFYKLGVTSNVKPIKSARIIGEVMGKFHPHGDSSIEGALVTMVNSANPYVIGIGNWGSITGDKAAASRYTNAKLSKLGDMIFDPYYMPTITLVENYDGTDKEPLRLNAPLPLILLNGSQGIGVGTTTLIPAFTMDSVVKASIESLLGKPVTPLSIKSEGGGIVINQKKQMAEYLRTGVASLTYSPQYAISSNGTLTISGFPPMDIVKAMERASLLEGVKTGYESTSLDSGNGTQFTFEFNPRLSKEDARNAALNVVQAFSVVAHFKTNVIVRTVKGTTTRSTSIKSILTNWAKHRIAADKKATAWHIEKQKHIVWVTETMILAVDKREIILGLLSKKISDDELDAQLAKALKITLEAAKLILDLKVRRLKALDKAPLVKQLGEQKAYLAVLSKRLKNPVPFLVKQLENFIKDSK